MDGASRQIRKIMLEENLRNEKKHRIECCKHLATCTSVEQAADMGPMFKSMKAALKAADLPNASSTNNIYHLIDTELQTIEQHDTFLLFSHKKKAILSTAPKLPSITSSCHSLRNLRKGFFVE